MVLSTSIDGFTAGTPVEALTDDRDSLLAIGMNGEPLPIEHGYPARLVVPGLYGYVSATKWVVDLELTRFDRAAGVLDPARLVARAARSRPSRASTCPADGQTVAQGPVTFGGVAWAQHRGVQAVEVRIDDGPLAAGPARCGATPTTPGGCGASRGRPTSRARTRSRCAPPTTPARCRPRTRPPPAPDGATGWHSVSFEVG